MGDQTISGWSGALKQYYDDQKLTDMQARKSALLGMIRRTTWAGKGKPLPMITDPGQAALSGTYSTANTNRVGASTAQFLAAHFGKIFAVGGIENDVLDAAMDTRSAFDDLRRETGAKLDFVSRELAHTLFRGQNASCGVISAISEGGGQTTITVTDFADIANLGAGANLVAASAAGGALRGSGADYPVVSINRSAGTIVLTGTAATTSSWAAGDVLSREGSAPNGGDRIVPSGFADWIPDTAPTSGDSHYGVDRSSDPDKLAGLRLDASSGSVKEAVSEMAARILANGGEPDTLFVNPIRYQVLEMELDSFASHEKIGPRNASATIGYNAMRVAAGNGSVRIVSDSACPFYRAYMLTLDSWEFQELGGKPQPRLQDMGNGELLQLGDADVKKFWAVAKGDLACVNPGMNGVIKFN